MAHRVSQLTVLMETCARPRMPGRRAYGRPAAWGAFQATANMSAFGRERRFAVFAESGDWRITLLPRRTAHGFGCELTQPARSGRSNRVSSYAKSGRRHEAQIVVNSDADRPTRQHRALRRLLVGTNGRSIRGRIGHATKWSALKCAWARKRSAPRKAIDGEAMP